MTTDELKQKAAELKTVIQLKSPEELRKATKYSLRGFMAVVLGEKAFRTYIVVFLFGSILAATLLFFGLIGWCECALMIYVVFMALVGEIVNTAIETTIDRISTEYHELSGKAKDIGSAIVFVSFFGAGLVWAVILLGMILRLLRS